MMTVGEELLELARTRRFPLDAPACLRCGSATQPVRSQDCCPSCGWIMPADDPDLPAIDVSAAPSASTQSLALC